MQSGWTPPTIDTTRAHPSRRYDYWLGGKDNYAVDRESSAAVEAVFPTIRLAARENRNFLGRAVSYLAGAAGIRQFLDIGTGLPAADNVHTVAQSVDPSCRVVYVDNDPIVLAHARALLHGTTKGATAYIDADLRQPESILSAPALRATLDLTEPVALTLVAIMHFITDENRPYELVNELLRALAPGSYLVMTHATYDYLPPEQRERAAEANVRSGVTFRQRSQAEFSKFFDGLDMIDPGITSVLRWRPPIQPAQQTVEAVSMLCGVAQIPR